MAKVLIVEDEIDINEVYQMVLNKAGHKVYSALNGQEALEITKSVEPNLILLDLRMPKMDGLAFLKKYQPKKTHPKVKVIVLSNYDTHKEITEAQKLGAERYVLKAWLSPKELEKLVNSVI